MPRPGLVIRHGTPDGDFTIEFQDCYGDRYRVSNEQGGITFERLTYPRGVPPHERVSLAVHFGPEALDRLCTAWGQWRLSHSEVDWCYSDAELEAMTGNAER